MKSGLIRGRPVKRDGQASNGSETLTFQNNGHVNGDHVTVIKSSVKTTKVVQESATTTIDVIDIDDLPDVDEEIDIDTKRKKTPRRAAAITKKQKTTEVLSATTREVKTQRVSAPKPAKKPPAAAKAKADVRETSKVVSEVVSEDSAMQDDVSNAVAAAAPMKADLDAQKEREDVPCNLVTSTRIPTDIAHRDYPHRYVKIDKRSKKDRVDTEEELAVIAHYEQAEVAGKIYSIGECVLVFSGLEKDFIGRILEFYEKEDNSAWFGVQWFFRHYDTGMGKEGRSHDPKRIYYSDVKDENLLDTIVGKVTVVRVPSKVRFDSSPRKVPKCDFYFDMGYKFAYTTFYKLPKDLPEPPRACKTSSIFSLSEEDFESEVAPKKEEDADIPAENKKELKLLDLYCGCGAMSTGLCLGANLAGINLVTAWAVDLNEFACISMKHNHPETTVRNEAAEDYLELLKEWQKLCERYPEGCVVEEDSDEEEDGPPVPGEYEVERLIGIRWIGEVSEKDKEVMEQVDDMEDSEELAEMKLSKQASLKSSVPKESEPDLAKGLEFKVRWKNYTPEHDTWEPSSSLEHCPERVKEFVIEGRKCKILPLPGDCDVVCGGPPCQGASGFNRFRNKLDPLEDPRNKQMAVYMDIVEFLRPRYFLMENVVDILKFCEGILGRYALARAVNMNYQAKVGLMAAGCYGMPQFRMRCFLFGACSEEVLPPYPMPTHKAKNMRGGVPNLWERCLVGYEEYKQPEWLQDPLVLKDAFSDLPPVTNFQNKDDIPYEDEPHTTFQHFIRLPKRGTGGLASELPQGKKVMLPDHRPLCLNTDDYERVCQIPKKKGANFRDLKGIIIKEDGITVDVVREPRELLKSGKPLVPDYAVTFIRGRSLKPFGRLWWDETVATVVTRAEPHNQIILHPEQDRVLTIRENARLQGFPDYYKLFGPIKQRYMQVGNAVAVPVATALGYALGQSFLQKVAVQEETLELPREFPYCLTLPTVPNMLTTA